MTLKHKSNFSDSSVMRELERKEVNKDEYKISLAARQISQTKSEQMVKTASNDLVPTDSLFGDLINLAIGLRERGMVKQAEELEQKVSNYKIAETHLYHVHDESGDDLLNHAHKDGEVTIAPSSKGYGVIETTQSAAKKIKDIVLKAPTGKTSEAMLPGTEMLHEELEGMSSAKPTYQHDCSDCIFVGTQKVPRGTTGTVSPTPEDTEQEIDADVYLHEEPASIIIRTTDDYQEYASYPIEHVSIPQELQEAIPLIRVALELAEQKGLPIKNKNVSAALKNVAEALLAPVKKKVNAQAAQPEIETGVAAGSAQKLTEQVQANQAVVTKAVTDLAKSLEQFKGYFVPKNLPLTFLYFLANPRVQQYVVARNKRVQWYVNKINLAKRYGIDMSTEKTLQASLARIIGGRSARNVEGETEDFKHSFQTTKRILIEVVGNANATGQESFQHVYGYFAAWRNDVIKALNTINAQNKQKLDVVNGEVDRLINHLDNSKNYTITTKSDSYNKAISNLTQVQTVLSTMGISGNIKKLEPDFTALYSAGMFGKITKTIANYTNHINKSIKKIHALIPGELGKSINDPSAKVTAAKARDYYRAAANLWAKNVSLIQQGKDKESDSDIVNENFQGSSQLAGTMDRAISSENTVGQVIASFDGLIEDQKISSIKDILNHSIQWYRDAKGLALTKGAASKVEISKQAFLKIAVKSQKNPRGKDKGQPARPSRGSGMVQKTRGKSTKDLPEANTVAMMQRVMGNLADRLMRIPEEGLKASNEAVISKKLAQYYAGLIRDTGLGFHGRGDDGNDGKWGTKTEGALRAIWDFAQKHNLSMAVGSFPQMYPRPEGVDSKQVIALAQKNADGIVALMKSANLGGASDYKNVTEDKPPAIERNTLFDKLPFYAIKKDPLTLAFTDPHRKGQAATADKPLYAGHMTSLYGFFTFLVDNKIRPVTTRAGGAARGYTIGEWDKIFNWFRKRSSALHNQGDKAENAVSNRAYMDAVNGLFGAYRQLRRAILEQYRGPQEGSDIVVLPKWLRDTDGQLGMGSRGSGFGQGIDGLFQVDEGIDLASPFDVTKRLNILATVRAWARIGARINPAKYQALASDMGVTFDEMSGGNDMNIAGKIARRANVPSVQVENAKKVLLYFLNDMKVIRNAFLSGAGMPMTPPPEMSNQAMDDFDKWFNAIRQRAEHIDSRTLPRLRRPK